jgi:hypothetical protein
VADHAARNSRSVLNFTEKRFCTPSMSAE